MKKIMAIAAGAAAAFAAAFFPLKDFCQSRMEKSIAGQKADSTEKRAHAFGFKDKAGKAFVEIVQIDVTECGGILEFKDPQKRGFAPQGEQMSTLGKRSLILSKTYQAEVSGTDAFCLKPSDFVFIHPKDGKEPKELEMPEKDFPIIIQH